MNEQSLTDSMIDPETLSEQLIDPSRYTSPEVLTDELDHVFGKAWLMACHLSYLVRPGDAYPFTIGNEPLLLVRVSENEIRAYYNICQHRGRQIITHARNVKSLKCFFHGFEWDLEGKIKNIPDREDFITIKDVDSLTLPNVRCETWGGFAWVNLNPDAEPLLEFLGPVAKELDKYKFEEYQLSEEVIVSWDVNWKIGADAFQEGYHGPVTHPQLQWFLEDSPDMQIDLFKLHNRGFYPIGAPCKRLSEEQRYEAHPGLKAMAAAEGVDADDFKGRVDEMRLEVQKARRANLTAKGCDVSELSDDQMTDDHHYFIFPNITINTFAANFSIFRYMPDGSDPGKMTFWFQSFLRKGPEEEQLPRPQTVHGGEGFKFDNEVYNQDASHMPWLQKGVRSKGFKGMLFCRQERRLRHFYDVLDQYISSSTK